MLKKLKSAAITCLPLTMTAAAFWATRAAYEAHLFEGLDFAQQTGFVLLIAVHLFAPIWAGVRPRWKSAAAAQLGLVALNDFYFLGLALTIPHGVMPHRCGLGSAMLGMVTLLGFFLFIPILLLAARAVHGRRNSVGPDKPA